MENDFKVLSENAIKYISFHDCHCFRLYYFEEKLFFEMEWMEVLAERPMNPYKQAHQSGAGKVLLQSPVLNKCELTTKNDEIIDVRLLKDIEFCDVELLQFEETEKNEAFRASIYFSFKHSEVYEFASMEIEYKKSYVMWNELNGLSWFEDDKWKKQIVG